MKKVTIATIFVALMMISSAAFAQTTASGTLTVTATINGSIQLVFNSNVSGVALTNSGTNAATLAFGAVSAFGTLPTGVTRTLGTNTFTVSSPVDVQVSKTNSTSANYKLQAQLNNADAQNTWSVGGVSIASGSLTQITATGAYATSVNFPVAITVPFNNTTVLNINNSINYVATAN